MPAFAQPVFDPCRAATPFARTDEIARAVLYKEQKPFSTP
jgi:hypothetical protein